MWSTVAFTVTASVIIHGVLASPVMYRLGEPGAEDPPTSSDDRDQRDEEPVPER
jgi:hypothetical protein